MTYPDYPNLVKVRGRGAGVVLDKGGIVPGYSCTLAQEKTPTDILTALLEYQDEARVTLGGVAPGLDVYIAFNIGYMDIWAACLEVQKVTGGRLYVDADPDDLTILRLWLKEAMTGNIIKQIRLGKNLTGINHLKDYNDYANRLYPKGESDLLLSTKTYSDVDVTPSYDASYGYLFLNEQYGAYNGWTGAGNALPGSITVKKPTGAWLNGVGHSTVNRSGGSWYLETKAYDGNIATAAGYYPWALHQWTDYLIIEFTPTTTTQLRFWRYGGGYGYGTINQVDISSDGISWTNVYYLNSLEGWDMYTVTFAEQEVKYVRYTAYRNCPEPGFDSGQQNEIQLWDPVGLSDDTSNWVQGANERTVRCDIGDYVDGVGYLISYTHAPFLIDLSSPTGRPSIYSKTENFSTDAVDELLARGRIRLADLGIPLISVNVDMVDRSIGDEDEDEYEIGDKVAIIDEGLGISEEATIVAYERPDLYQPGHIILEVATKRKDIIDLLSG